jgi:hypothetical protein
MGIDWKLDLNVIIASFALLATCVFFYIQIRRERVGLKREIYQRLELASNDIFRFEAEHLDLLDCLNSAEHFCDKSSQVYKGLIAYVTQVLNLFEIAVRFRRQNVMPPDVFGSWVIWFYDLCSADNFPEVWGDLRFNYLPDLRGIMDTCISIIARQTLKGTPDAARAEFFDFMAARFEDEIIKSWLNDERGATA